ncbi:hypothetical protein BJ912DRAFT_1123634 [Pholiota molesta]|nr:hypothetical protein BJ912DRAFT_1123634 [Pholiota molesta]
MASTQKCPIRLALLLSIYGIPESQNRHPSTSVPALGGEPADGLPAVALMEEDMEHLRARRKAGLNARRQQTGVSLPSPSNSTFSMGSNVSSVILGLGTGSSIRDVLPLKSTFFDWCAEYFKEPQMRQAEADEPGSAQ